jgi:hypothetical protein
MSRAAAPGSDGLRFESSKEITQDACLCARLSRDSIVYFMEMSIVSEQRLQLCYSEVKNSLLREIFVVERKMIVIQPYKSSSFSFQNRIVICPLFSNGEKIPAKIPIYAVATPPF